MIRDPLKNPRAFLLIKQYALLVAILIGASGCSSRSSAELPTSENTAEVLEQSPSGGDMALFDSRDVDLSTAPFDFQTEIPLKWQVEYIPEIEALSFYDPASEESSSLDQSQIFVRYFSASQFLTLNTVTIHSQTELTINGLPAVTYDIEKNADVADFPNQPSWRNQRHIVTDIRSTDDSPAVFYVFAARPDLDSAVFDAFLNSVVFQPDRLFLPIESFEESITLKPFGAFITPETSPVQPERFSGYHTGVDVEVSSEEDTWIYAMADGEVVYAGEANGYGGVMAIQHQVDDESVITVYGHLDTASMTVSVSDSVEAAQPLAVLGEGFTEETDGERKHLHFALLNGNSLDLRGYVQTDAELSAWIDPLVFFKNQGLL